jgi:2-C-methyl-D-erythritol 4-phosphate cytidylyltransferase
VSAARSVASFVVLVVPADALDEGAAAGADAVVAGGETRAASVRCGLAALPAGAATVVVHDAARPFASPALFRSVVAAVAGGAAGAVPGLPVADTLKRVDAASVVLATVSRESLVGVQTPQAFRATALVAAHAAGGDATDDAGLVEALGETVVVVPGDPRNIKLTEPADLPLLEALAGDAVRDRVET